LGSIGFTLAGGTEGGVITLDQLTSISIGADGSVSVSHPEKGTSTVGKVSLANFANPRGLLQEGTNYYSATVNSGSPVLCDPGTGGTGALKANSLEMSNVDLSQEFADMITTQRGFQANTRVITVSDTMLEELINLKR
jgi:flagellar hook protein FlgE